jgi:hypothetical protein
MKKSISSQLPFYFLFSLIVSATFFNLNAQVPEAFSYQAVVRNSSGELLTNQNVSFRISILQDSESGSIKYSETHRETTNDFGLANLKIGLGNAVEGIFDPGGWGISKHFIKVEIDTEGGSNYMEMGTTQLLAVPYAFHAKTVENDRVNDADSDPANEIQTLSVSGDKLSISKGNNVTLPAASSSWDQLGDDIRYSKGKVVIGNTWAQSDLTFGESNADITFANGAGSHLIWKEGTEFSKAWLGYNGNNINIDNFEEGGDIVIDAKDKILFQSDDDTKMSIFPGGQIGIGNSNPSANLHVTGKTKIGGPQAAGISEIRLLSGQLSSDDFETFVSLPSGYNEDNTMVLSLQIISDNATFSIGYFYEPTDNRSVSYLISGSRLSILVPMDSHYYGDRYRVLLLNL